jgi:hypothetical protein
MAPLGAVDGPKFASSAVVRSGIATEDSPSLPPRVVRSAVPGYLLVAAASLALGGSLGWRLGRQAEAIDEAASRTFVAQLPTTGALVPAPVVFDTPAPVEASAPSAAPKPAHRRTPPRRVLRGNFDDEVRSPRSTAKPSPAPTVDPSRLFVPRD